MLIELTTKTLDEFFPVAINPHYVTFIRDSVILKGTSLSFTNGEYLTVKEDYETVRDLIEEAIANE